MDLSKLVGGKPFIVSNKIAFNGCAIPIKSLVDSGANGYVFIDTRVACDSARTLGLKLKRLDQPCEMIGVSGKRGSPITHAIVMHLWVNGRRLLNVPMLLADLGGYEMILGRVWLAENEIWLDVKNRRLIWPKERSQMEEIAVKSQIMIPRSILKRPVGKPEHQEDADRRDRLLEQESIHDEKPKPREVVTISSKTWNHVSRTEKMDRRDDLAKMNRQLKMTTPEVHSSIPIRSMRNEEVPKTSEKLAFIGAAAFHRHEKSKKSETFISNLHEIDRIIEEKKKTIVGAGEDDEVAIEERLPEDYKEFRDVFSKSASDQMPPFRKGVDYKIVLNEGVDPNQAIGHAPLYKMSVEELETVKKYLEANLAKGFIAPVASPFASPILIAHTAGKLRFCVDYRKLNAISKKDRYPIPLVDELMERLNGAKYFTKLDIRQGFHRIRMDPETEDLTSFRTRYGTYKYKVVPFGLSNGPAVFQRFINTTFFDYLDRFMTAFIDDLLIYSKNLKEHKDHVKKVLNRLREAGLQASILKCEFHVQRTKYLGFIISTNGIEVDPEKIEIIQNWTTPTTVKGVQSFLGFCNFYRRFVKGYSRISKPLHRLTRKDQPFEWNHACQEAFEKLKRSLIEAPVLRHYDPNRETRVETDASDGTIAGVLSQLCEDGCWHPVAFYSASMNGAEKNYEIHDKEMLAIIRALSEWRAELEGLQREERFKILTDHRALEYFMSTKNLNARQARWAEFLSRFYFLIQYRPGRQNTLADALSRPEIKKNKESSRMQLILKPERLDPDIVMEQQDNPTHQVEMNALESELQVVDEIRAENRAAESLESWRKKVGEEKSPWKLVDGLLCFNNRLIVPIEENPTLRAKLLKEIHEQSSVAHPGKRKLRALVRERYYWTGWTRDVDQYVSNCLVCRRTKIARDKTPGLLKPLPIPKRSWQHISMDFMDAPMTKTGHNAMLVMVCRLSKKPISIPTTRKVNARELAKLFLRYYYRYYGAPESIVSDRGPQFVSDFWNEFTKLLGIKLKLSTAHHAQTDGQTEVVNQYLATKLRPYVNYYQDDWDNWLPMMDHAAGALENVSIGMTPFQVANGYEPRMSFDWKPLSNSLPRLEKLNREDARKQAERMKEIWEMAAINMNRAQRNMEHQANKHRREPDFGVGDKVFLSLKDYKIQRPSRKLAEQNEGPFEILEKIGNSYRLRLPASMKINPVLSPDKLRKAADNPLPGQVNVPPEPIEIEGENEWEIEEVLASRINRGKLQYRVKWLGFDDDFNWYPARNLKGSPHLLRKFHTANPTKAGPPKRLGDWLEAWGKDDYLPDDIEDDLPA